MGVDDGYTPALDPATNQPFVLTSTTPIRYKVWFQIQGVSSSTILLATPYFDDITFYFDNGGPEILYVTMVPIG
jgi:hypothetical protein